MRKPFLEYDNILSKIFEENVKQKHVVPLTRECLYLINVFLINFSCEVSYFKPIRVDKVRTVSSNFRWQMEADMKIKRSVARQHSKLRENWKIFGKTSCTLCNTTVLWYFTSTLSKPFQTPLDNVILGLKKETLSFRLTRAMSRASKTSNPNLVSNLNCNPNETKTGQNGAFSSDKNQV